MKGEKEMDENVKVWSPTQHATRQEIQASRKRATANYRDMMMNAAIMLFAVLIGCLITGWRVSAKLKAQYTREIMEERFKVEQEVSARYRSEYGIDAAEAENLVMQEEARMLAKMLYSMQYNSDAGLKSACWCALNRVDSQWYPNSIAEVCAQDKQWMGWSEDNPVVERLYNIALDAVTQWHKGIHAVGTDFLFMDWNTKEITLRTKYEGGYGCHYWYESDWA